MRSSVMYQAVLGPSNGFIITLLVFVISNSVVLKNQKIRKTAIRPKKGKRKVQGVSQSQTAALPRPQEEEETDKSKQAETEQTYEKH